MANNLNNFEIIEKNTKDLPSKEYLLGKGLTMPFKGTVSGARSILASLQREQTFSLITPEKAIIETGYEIRYGDRSSSITKADRDYEVIAKISKFSFAPNHHYWLILKDKRSNYLDIVERISYHYITESYGYLYNNETLDSLNVGDNIKKDAIIQKSLSFDEYNNRRDGVNLNVAYMALDDNMEDSVILSDVAATKLSAPLIKPVEIMINDNDIPLNIYGDDTRYKIIPDIGEEIDDANLIVLRKEKKDEAYYAQSINKLRDIMYLSDDKKQVIGRVIDINIYCNNPDILESYYYSQLKMYYNENKRVAGEFERALTPFTSQGYTLSYELKKQFGISKRIRNNDQYMDKKPYSNIIIEIDVLEEKQIEPGDKVANRYGGKGVCSDIWEQKLMPRFKNFKGEYEYFDMIFNSSTMINRENVGQTIEQSLNHISSGILGYIVENKLTPDKAYTMIHKFVSMCSPQQAEFLEKKKNEMSREEFLFFLDNIINSGNIQLSMRPLSDIMTIDKLNEIYKVFPFVKQNEVEVALISSEGKLRYIKARRPMVVGKQYIYRLKQYAEEKFSATSLSATNIRNENTKSRVKKDFRELYSNTPIRFGNMEAGNLGHVGIEPVIAIMMLHSLSPQGRRLVEQMYTGDPFNIDIKLNSDASNRGAEIASTYLKTIGRRLRFIKSKKKIKKISFNAVSFDRPPVKQAVDFIPVNERENFDPEKDWEERKKLRLKIKESGAKSPIIWMGANLDQW